MGSVQGPMHTVVSELPALDGGAAAPCGGVACSSRSLATAHPVEILEVSKDDPAQHQGAARAFPHVRGNWATSLYVPGTDDVPVRAW